METAQQWMRAAGEAERSRTMFDDAQVVSKLPHLQ
jgi:hypothetical protein